MKDMKNHRSTENIIENLTEQSRDEKLEEMPLADRDCTTNRFLSPFQIRSVPHSHEIQSKTAEHDESRRRSQLPHPALSGLAHEQQPLLPELPRFVSHGFVAVRFQRADLIFKEHQRTMKFFDASREVNASSLIHHCHVL